MIKYTLLAGLAIFLFSPTISHAGLFCEGYAEGYVEGYEQESKIIKAPKSLPCPDKRRYLKHEDFIQFKLGYTKGLKCGEQHRTSKIREKCKR